MSRKKNTTHSLDDLITIVDDELYQELTELNEQQIVHIIVWEDSVADALEEGQDSPENQLLFDLDLYLKDGAYLELFGVLCYKSLDLEPLQGAQTVNDYLAMLQKDELWLEEIAVDEEDSPVLVLGRQHQPSLYLMVGACAVAEWTELP